MKKISMLLVVAVLFSFVAPAFATLGPIHVELNMVKPRISAARANTVTAFKVYMRYNVNIKIHDWIKIWFPIDEYVKSDNPIDVIRQICDGLPVIDENINNPRFVPNDEYFKKYDNPKLKELKQIYALVDERGSMTSQDCPDLSNIADWGSACKPEFGKTRIVKDPSGLGCWMLGTVFPSMPVDQKLRMERLKRIINSASIGYSPCGECEGYEIIINNCKERSYQQNSPLEIEAWRKGYNSIDINTSKTTGIIGPATPGRYRVAMATLPEPEPVESEAFVLPCSDVSDVKLESSFLYDVKSEFKILFKAGEGGALDGGASTIRIKFPKEFTIPAKFQVKSIKLNGTFVSSQPKQFKTDDGTIIEIIAPSDVNNMGSGKLEFLSNSGVTWHVTRKPVTVELATSSEPNFIKSEPYSLSLKSYISADPDGEFQPPQLLCFALIPEGKSYPAKTEVTLTFPVGFILPKTIPANSIMIDGSMITTPTKVDGNRITVVDPVAIDVGARIMIKPMSGIVNPKQGKYKFSMTIGKDQYDLGELEIKETKGVVTNLDLSDYQGSVESTYQFFFQPSSSKSLETGDTISIEFPQGTVLPASFDCSMIKIDSKSSPSASTKGQTLTFELPAQIKASNPATIKIGIPIANPRQHGSYRFHIDTSKGDSLESEEYVVEPSPLKSWIYFKDPDKPNCDGWFNNPPILGFDCLNPEAKIAFWFNGQADKVVYYGGEARLMPGSQRAKITWQAEFNGVKEELQTIDFNLDTVKPSLRGLVPDKNVVITNTKSFLVGGWRVSQEMIIDGYSTKYKVVDDVFLRINGGQQQQLLKGEIYEVEHEDKVALAFRSMVSLNEGENTIEFIARDQACNETIITKKIVLDTIQPKIDVVSPDSSQIIYEDEPLVIKIKTESLATVSINGIYANLDSEVEGIGIFSSEFMPVRGTNRVKIYATDLAGNTAFAYLDIYAKSRQDSIVLKLTLDKTSWTVNGEEQPPLKVAPTNKFSDPKLKAINGTTFMPVAQIAPLFNCMVEWDPKPKKVTLRQKLDTGEKVLELWLNKNTAKIDGKEVKYDAKGILFPFSLKGSTMLPFRWFAENLGADVIYDVKTKQITLIYPSNREEK